MMINEANNIQTIIHKYLVKKDIDIFHHKCDAHLNYDVPLRIYCNLK